MVLSVLAGISVLVLGLLLVFASGMFPAEARPASMASRRGWWLLVAAMLGAAVLAGAALAGVRTLDWPWLVIAGGLGILFAPVLYQSLPTWLQDTPVAALGLSALAVLVGLVWLALA